MVAPRSHFSQLPSSTRCAARPEIITGVIGRGLPPCSAPFTTIYLRTFIRTDLPRGSRRASDSCHFWSFWGTLAHKRTLNSKVQCVIFGLIYEFYIDICGWFVKLNMLPINTISKVYICSTMKAISFPNPLNASQTFTKIYKPHFQYSGWSWTLVFHQQRGWTWFPGWGVPVTIRKRAKDAAIYNVTTRCRCFFPKISKYHPLPLQILLNKINIAGKGFQLSRWIMPHHRLAKRPVWLEPW